MTPEQFQTYPGSVTATEHDRVAALRFTPGANAYGRYVTLETFTPPLLVAGWIVPLRFTQNRTPGNPAFDGIHVHVGHIGNNRNYVASLVRRDGGHKIAVEYGWRGYTSIYSSRRGPELILNRTYMFEVEWGRDYIRSYIGNEAQNSYMEGPIPDRRRLPVGSVGFRLDNLVAVGDISIRKL